MSELRFVLSGPGLIGRKHAELIAASPQAKLVAVVAPDNPLNNEFCETNAVPLFQDLDVAINVSGADAVILSSPNAFHHEQAQICIENRTPVLVEKPLTDDLKTAELLAIAAEQSGVPILVGHHRTYSPLLEVARNFITSDFFGTPVSVQGSALFYKPDHYFLDGPWRTMRGGGPILINMIHEVGILRFLFGEIASVTAKLSSATRGFEVEDSAAITFAFESGALGSFILSDASASNKSWEMTAGENPAYPFYPHENCYHFSGTKGSLDFPSMRFCTYEGQAEQSWWSEFKEGRLTVERQDPLARQLQHFINVVNGLEEPKVSARDGFKNMVVLEAIIKAASTGRETQIRQVR